MKNQILDILQKTKQSEQITVQKIIQKQKIKHRRRSKGAGRRKGYKRSVWSTFATTFTNSDDKTFFNCRVCDYVGSFNKSLLTSIVIERYKSKHRPVYVDYIH